MIAALFAMAAAGFLAATPLPMSSEPVFAGLQIAGSAPVWALIAVASIANTAGSILTWGMGRGARELTTPSARNADRLARAESWFTRWGLWSLLLSWAPLGDVLCFVSGSLRTPLWQFTAIVGLAKTLRYVVLAGVIGGGAALIGS